MAPGILLALNPSARLPTSDQLIRSDATPTIEQIHRLARLQIIKELAPFVANIFQELIDYGLIKDSSRSFHESFN